MTDHQKTQRVKDDVCSRALIRRIAAMLDFESSAVQDLNELPLGWHFALMGGEVRRSDLRGDGFPGFGVPLPDLGLPRVLLGGRQVTYNHPIAVGDTVVCKSSLGEIAEKQIATGRMAIVNISNELTVSGASEAAIRETQTYFLLEGQGGHPKPAQERTKAQFEKTVRPDDTLLFQYSALGFNSHKIHLDRDYARTVEGLPDLVVNGGLITLLVTEALRNDLGVELRTLKSRHTAPLYVNRDMTIAANPFDGGWDVSVFDDANVLAAHMKVEVR